MDKYLNSYLSTLPCWNLETGDFPGPVITISRQAGCSARRIAIKLSKILTGYSYMSETKTDQKWSWVDVKAFKKMVESMKKDALLGDYDDTEEVLELLDKVNQAYADETLYEISDEKLISILKGVICKLANKGRQIIVGRSAGVILQNVPNSLNIRLEAPVDWRIHRVMQLRDCSSAEATEYINEVDKKRDSFIEKVTGRKAENNDFDVIFNYASLEDDLVVDAVLNILRNKKVIARHGSF